MRIKLLIASLFIALLFVMATTEAGNEPSPQFVTGQEWSIKSPSPTTAKVIVGRIEKWGDKVAVHVSIIDIPIPQGISGAGGRVRIGHVAFEESALKMSVDQLLATGVSPATSFEDGYNQWKAQQGDLTVMSVAQTIEFGLAAMNQVQQ